MEGLTDTKSLPPSSHTSFPPEKTTPLTLRDASFSCYLPPDAPKKDAPFPAKEDDFEIGIFDARKYFNESCENQHRESTKVEPPPVAAVQHVESMSATRASSVSSVEPPPFHDSSPGVCSEASWSSIASEKTNVRKWFSGMICKIICLYPCSCWGKKKEEVEDMEKVSELPRSLNYRNLGSDPNSQRKSLTVMHKVSKNSKSLDRGRGDWTLSDRCGPPIFPPEIHLPSIPVLLGQPSSSPPKLVFTSEGNPILLKEPPRHSLEIFRPSDFCISEKSSGSDSIPPPRILAPNRGAHDRQRSFKFSVSPKSGAAAMDDEDEDEDEASDTSSNLFEIESLTTGTPTNTATDYIMCQLGRDSMEVEEAFRRFVYGEFGTPSECYAYEPSEASVEWSVTTAEGFDRGSATNFSASASDIVDDVTLMRLELQRLGNGGSVGGGGRRRENGILETCRCGLRR